MRISLNSRLIMTIKRSYYVLAESCLLFFFNGKKFILNMPSIQLSSGFDMEIAYMVNEKRMKISN